jgi:hypothetical protein
LGTGIVTLPLELPAAPNEFRGINASAEKLIEHSRLPLAWHDQRTALGFA